MTFGHDFQDVEYFDGNYSMLRARQFNEHLRKSRHSTTLKDLPIIFLGHGLGGLFILNALDESHLDESRFGAQPILDVTQGILFFGSPLGGPVDGLHSMVPMRNAPWPDIRWPSIRRDLEPYLSEVEHGLAVGRIILRWLRNIKPTVKITGFYETVMTPSFEQELKQPTHMFEDDISEDFQQQQIQIIEKLSRIIQFCHSQLDVLIAVDRNRTDIVKFNSIEHLAYRRVLRTFNDCIAPAVVGSRSPWKLSNYSSSAMHDAGVLGAGIDIKDYSQMEQDWRTEGELLQPSVGSAETPGRTKSIERLCQICGWSIPDYYSSVDNDLPKTMTITQVGNNRFIAKTVEEFLLTELSGGSSFLEVLKGIFNLCSEITKTKETHINKVISMECSLQFSDEDGNSPQYFHLRACYDFLEVYVDKRPSNASDIIRGLQWIVAAIVPEMEGMTHMFEFACVVVDESGYHSYLNRFHDDDGLYLDFSLLVALAAVEREIITTEGVILLGFDTALIPLKPLRSKRWHFVCKPGKQMTARDIATYGLPRLQGDNYQQGTVSVGWCPTAEITMGTTKDGVNIKESGVRKVTERRIMAGTDRAIQLQLGGHGGIGGSAFVGNIAFQRQTTRSQAAVVAIRSAAENFARVITQASSMRVIVFDNAKKQAWMVPAVVVPLFSSLCLIEKENYHHFEDESGNEMGFTYASKSHNAEESAAEALKSNRDIFMRRSATGGREPFSDLIKAIWYDMTRGETICRNELTGQLIYEKSRVFGYDLSEAILGQSIYLRGFEAKGATAKWPFHNRPHLNIGSYLAILVHFTLHSTPNSAATGPCAYCSDLHRIQSIHSDCNSRQQHTLRRIWKAILPKGEIEEVTLESIDLDAQGTSGFQADQLLEKGAVRFGSAFLGSGEITNENQCSSWFGRDEVAKVELFNI
ncbi:hypothetical protein K440DRAFT_641121 [Wilcoxina mikolae CBS 423.85]|nr:hypothetical protein K440DRAFT_641121 [Wilcoxina mikolae CBS 423.85]